MIKKDVGIVLKMVNYRESDGLASLLLREGGLRSFVYRSYYKPTSKSLAKGLPLTVLQLEFNDKNKGLLQARQMDIISSYSVVKEDVSLNLFGSIFSEMMLKTTIIDEQSKFYYDLGITYLDLIKENQDNFYYFALLMSTYLQSQGLQPEVDHDVHTLDTRVNHFSIEDGGLVLRPANPGYSPKQLKQLRLLFKMNFSRISLIPPFEIDSTVISTMVDYFTYHTGITLRSWKILQILQKKETVNE